MNARHLLLVGLVTVVPAMTCPRAQTASDSTAAETPRRDTSAGIPVGSDATERLDARAFRYVYRQQSPAFANTMRSVNSASVRLFLTAVPVSGAIAFATDSDLDPTIRLAASTVGAVGTVYGIKSLVRRERPYNALDGIEARVRVPEVDPDPFSLPSGHAAVAFAMATSTTLSYPRWYVAAPGYAWATATAVARVWHGVHFPSDIILGAAIGACAAGLVHVLIPEVDSDEADPVAAPAPPSVTLHFAL